MFLRYLYTTCTRHKITNESCTWSCRRDMNWIWIMRCFLQVPSYNFALHHVQFQIGSMMLAPCNQRQMGSRVFTASTMVQPGQHCTKGSIQTALPQIQTRKSNAKKWTKRKGNHIWNVWTGHGLKWLLTHGFISVLGRINFRSQRGHETVCTAQYQRTTKSQMGVMVAQFQVDSEVFTAGQRGAT